jgi:hypothetical protein
MRRSILLAALCVGLVCPIAVRYAFGENRTDPAGSAIAIPSVEELLGRLKHEHPRLLIDKAGFVDLRRRIETDEVLKRWDAKLQQDAAKFLKMKMPEHVLPDGKRLLDTSRRMVAHCATLAMMYRLHGDRRCLDRLWQELQTVAAFKDFNPAHFLDTAEMTYALAIAYDWLYDDWSESQRATIREAIVKLGLQPGLHVYHAKSGWHRATHNWNQVCNGGLTAGALAVGDEEPAIAGEVLHEALVSVQLAMRSYAPDGGWGEGPGYWGYATSYNVMMLACLESALGTEFGLASQPGFEMTGLFPVYMTGAGNYWFNYADCSEHAGRTDCLLWLGHRFHLPAATRMAAMTDSPTAAGLIWYHDQGKDPAAAQLPLDRYWQDVEVATMRSSWTDPQAVFVGIQARSHTMNHEHLDMGSFVLDALGQRWAVDLGADNYNLPGYFGSQRYEYYRLRAEGHNTLVIAPTAHPDQEPNARCKIVQFNSKPHEAMAIADLTSAYAGRATTVRRGIALVDRRYLIVQDEIAGAQGDVWWFLHTPAAIHVDPSGRQATLSLGGKQLMARIMSPSSARFEVRDAAPLPSSPNPTEQKRNDGVRKLAIRLKSGDGLLNVALIPADGQGEVTPPKIRPLSSW